MPETPDDASLKCSEWARRLQLDPIASIGCYRAYLLVDISLPWPPDLSELEALTALVPALKRAGCRLQGAVASKDAELRRVALYWSDPVGFSSYKYFERFVPPIDVSTAAADILDAFLENDLAVSGDSARREILVCTHGRRDRCCGSFGSNLAFELQATKEVASGEVRLTRTSHTGGHRFAPTVVVLPEGTGWAYADVHLVANVIRRTGDLADLLPRYRGCSGLGSREAQVLERQVLQEVGWSGLTSTRTWEQSDASVSLHIQPLHGETSNWSAELESGRRLPIPQCGAPLSAARKFETELTSRNFRKII